MLHTSCAFVPETAMRRREFISFVGSVAATWPLAARAQQSAMPVVGFINAAPAQSYGPQLAAFLKGLDEKGYVDGRDDRIPLGGRSY
jgi:putative tryptophan/tyrosine transport system substrate-binding protein